MKSMTTPAQAMNHNMWSQVVRPVGHSMLERAVPMWCNLRGCPCLDTVYRRYSEAGRVAATAMLDACATATVEAGYVMCCGC